MHSRSLMMMKTLAAMVILGSGSAWAANLDCLQRLACPGDDTSGPWFDDHAFEPEVPAWAVLLMLGVAVGDVTYTVVDAVKAARGERLSKGAAAGEVLLAAPQLALSIAAAGDDDSGFAIGLAIWTGALALHGVVTLFLPEETTPAVTLAPAYVPGGGGLVASGRF